MIICNKCDDTGYVCNSCSESAAACLCNERDRRMFGMKECECQNLSAHPLLDIAPSVAESDISSEEDGVECRITAHRSETPGPLSGNASRFASDEVFR